MGRAKALPFFMSFLQQGLAILETLVPAEKFSSINSDKAFSIAQDDTSSADDLSSLCSNPNSYLILDDQIPRDPVVAKQWIDDTSHYFPANDIKVFINDIPDDPHSRFDHGSLHFFL